MRRNPLLALAVALVVAGLALVAVRTVTGRAEPRVEAVVAGPLGGCPATPNCVSTLATDGSAAIEPLRCDAAAPDALDAVGRALPGDVERVDDGAWVVRSRVFGFPDDVLVAVDGGRVDVLSASRIGTDDLGVNRARVEAVRDALALDPVC